MSLSGSNRRQTDRISKRKPDSEEPEVANSSSPSRRSPTTQPSQKIATNPTSKSASLPKKDISFEVAESKKSEKLPVSTISKRQPIVPATESKRASAKLPIAEPKKSSGKIPIAKPAIVPPTPSATSASTRRSSSMETTISKPQIGSVSSRKVATPAEVKKTEEPVEPVKSSTKRARASGSSQKSGRSSAKGAPRKGGYSNKSVNSIYAVLGGILLILIVLIAISLSSKPKPKTIITLNQLDAGKELCNQAQRTYTSNNENVGEALRMLEDGIGKMETELNKLRNANGDLPSNYAGYDSQLATWLGYRKMLREQNLINSARKERKGGN